MTQPLILTRDVTTKECPWLDRDFKEGEKVFPYHGPTYGAISPAGKACSIEEDKTPFFEFPHTAFS
jgi:hypothetical protein